MGLIGHIGDERLTMTVAPADGVGVEEVRTFDLTNWNFDPEHESAMSALGFKPFTPEISTTLVTISEGGAGEAAGLQAGDTLLAANGQPITNWQQVVELIQGHPNQAIDLQIERASEVQNLILTPDSRVNLRISERLDLPESLLKSQNGRKIIASSSNLVYLNQSEKRLRKPDKLSI